MDFGISITSKKNSTKWTEKEIKSLERSSESDKSNFLRSNDNMKINPEIKLEEETEGFVYKTDFRGHLQLINIEYETSNHHCIQEKHFGGELAETVESTPHPLINQKISIGANEKRICYPALESKEKWSVSENNKPLIVAAWEKDSDCSKELQPCKQTNHLNNCCSKESIFIKEEPDIEEENEYSEICEYSDNTWEAQLNSSDQVSSVSSDINLKNSSILLTQAEKKRLYRMRLKEKNPSMWSTIKKKEAARKRELRQKRRHVLYEMQKAMEWSSNPTSSNAENQRVYLEALKERHPELWNQLANALPLTQTMNEPLLNENNGKDKSICLKPTRMYKDVIEAQKKRLYRQRIKKERPEMYERQKARDACARSIQRLLLKKKLSLDQNSLHSSEVENKLNYLKSLQINSYPFLPNTQIDSDPSDDFGVGHPNLVKASSCDFQVLPPTHIPYSEKDPSQICDNKSLAKCGRIPQLSEQCSSEASDKNKESLRNCEFSASAACSVQSDVLWYWNDEKSTEMQTSNVPCRRAPQVMTGEERLQKILKEQMQMREKRKKYRTSMTPEKRFQFLGTERERLKVYRLTKKAAKVDANNVLCINR